MTQRPKGCNNNNNDGDNNTRSNNEIITFFSSVFARASENDQRLHRPKRKNKMLKLRILIRIIHRLKTKLYLRSSDNIRKARKGFGWNIKIKILTKKVSCWNYYRNQIARFTLIIFKNMKKTRFRKLLYYKQVII